MHSRRRASPGGRGPGQMPAVAMAPAGAPRQMVPAVPTGPAASLYGLSLKRTWAWLQTQPAAYWLISVYLFLEYVRPNNIYEPIKGWPLTFWCLILCCVAVAFDRGRLKRPWTAGDTMLVLFTIILLLSCVTAYNPSLSMEALTDYLTWLLIYMLITAIVNTEKRFLVFMLGYFLWCLKMSQHGVRGWMTNGFGFSSYGVSCAPAFFQNSGECGVQMAMFFPVSLFFVVALKPYWSRTKFRLAALIPLSAVITIMASSSRGAQLALGVLFLWLVVRNVKNWRLLIGVLALAGVAYAILPEEQRQRFRDMGEDDTSKTRLAYWADARDVMRNYPVLGVGYNNWVSFYRRNYPWTGGQMVHNIFYQAGTELGFTGLFAFIGMIVATFWVNRKTRRLARQLPDGGRFAWHMTHGFDGALIGYMAAGFFVTVLYYPFFWINLAMTVALYNSTQYELKRYQRALAVQRTTAWVGGAAPAAAAAR